jgi:hypothetical protein
VTLGERQRLFTRLVAKLIEHAYETGYQLTFGEAFRTPEQAALNAKVGKGITQSLHGMRLAIDLNLFRNGEYLTDSEAHRPLGEYWKTLHPDCCWGGDFSRPDGNHYSLQYGGIK